MIYMIYIQWTTNLNKEVFMYSKLESHWQNNKTIYAMVSIESRVLSKCFTLYSYIKPRPMLLWRLNFQDNRLLKRYWILSDPDVRVSLKMSQYQQTKETWTLIGLMTLPCHSCELDMTPGLATPRTIPDSRYWKHIEIVEQIAINQIWIPNFSRPLK